MASKAEDDLQPDTTDGFKVGEKKTVEEYAMLGKTYSSIPANGFHVLVAHASNTLLYLY